MAVVLAVLLGVYKIEKTARTDDRKNNHSPIWLDISSTTLLSDIKKYYFSCSFKNKYVCQFCLPNTNKT
jgi:hypothetical protein